MAKTAQKTGKQLSINASSCVDLAIRAEQVSPEDLQDALSRYSIRRSEGSSREQRRWIVTSEDMEDAATVYAEFRHDDPDEWGLRGRWEWQVWPQGRIRDTPDEVFVAIVFVELSNEKAATDRAIAETARIQQERKNAAKEQAA